MLVQPTLDIPAEISARILSGELFRNGSVVRVAATGQIYKLLDEIPNPVSQRQAKKILAQATKTLKDPKILVPALTAGMVIVVAIDQWQKRKAGEPDVAVVQPAVPECVERYNASLAKYVDAIRGRHLSVELLDEVLADLDAVKAYAHPDGENVLDFSTEHAKALLSIVAEYTKQLAEANGVDLADSLDDAPDSEASEIVTLRQHLEVQKRIFLEAA